MDSAVLLFLSKYNPRNYNPNRKTDPQYKIAIPGAAQKTVSGLQTNDAPCKYLLRRAAAEGKPVSTILCLVSKADLKRIDPKQIPPKYQTVGQDNNSVTYFDKVIEQCVRYIPGLTMPNIVTIPYDFTPDQQPLPADARDLRIYEQIAHYLTQNNIKHLYVDFTGGMRDTSFLLMELSRFLGFLDIPCEDIVYSNLTDRTILSLRTAYQMFPILSGISSFLNTGNARQLQQAYSGDEASPEGRLLSSLTRFAQSMSLCKLENIEELYGNIIDSLNELENTAQHSIDIQILKDFVPKIREKFHITAGSAKTSYLGLIQWCLDNDMLQQALTLYVEKVPEYCLDTGIIKMSNPNDPTRAHKSQAVSVIGSIYNKIAEDPDLVEFVTILEKIRKNCAPLTSMNAVFDEVRKWRKGVMCTQAVKRFENEAKRCFHNSGQPWRPNPSATVLIPNTEYTYTVRDFSGFVNITLAQPPLLHYFLYTKKYEKPDSSILRRDALIRLKSDGRILAYTNINHLTGEQMRQVLLYYAAITAIRNEVNHAAEGSNSELLHYCHQEGALASETADYATIKDVLSSAVAYMLDLSRQLGII